MVEQIEADKENFERLIKMKSKRTAYLPDTTFFYQKLPQRLEQSSVIIKT